MVGGAPISQEFADEIGADAYTEDAASAAEQAKKYAESGFCARQRLENLIRHLQRIVKKLLRQEKPRNQRKILQLRKLLQKMVPGFESPYRLSRIL